MKKAIKVMALVFCSGIVLLFACICLLIPKPPKEAALIQNFNAHRANFEQLRDMLLTDTNLRRVASWGVETRKPLFLGYPSDINFPRIVFSNT